MQLRVTFREEHVTGESGFGLTSSSLGTQGPTPTRRTVAMGINAVRQFADEAKRGLRAPGSVIRGTLESPPPSTG